MSLNSDKKNNQTTATNTSKYTRTKTYIAPLDCEDAAGKEKKGKYERLKDKEQSTKDFSWSIFFTLKGETE